MMEMNPMGIKPMAYWVAERVDTICEAMRRYNSAGKSVPKEWIFELSNHYKWLDENKYGDLR